MKRFQIFTGRQWATMLIIGATTGALVACVFIAAQFSSEPGDILGFFGGAIGAGLAVIGALWLDQRKATEARDEARKMLSQTLIQLGLAAGRFSQAPDFGVAAMLLTFRQAVQTFETIRSGLRIDDAVAYLSMSSVIYWARVYDEEAEVLYNGLTSGDVLPGQARSNFSPRADALVLAIRNTLGSHPFWLEDSVTTLNNLLAAPAPWAQAMNPNGPHAE